MPHADPLRPHLRALADAAALTLGDDDLDRLAPQLVQFLRWAARPPLDLGETEPLANLRLRPEPRP